MFYTLIIIVPQYNYEYFVIFQLSNDILSDLSDTKGLQDSDSLWELLIIKEQQKI